MKQAGKLFRNIEELAAGAFLVLLCLVVACQVFSRFILQDPFVWAEELARLFFVWLVFAGAAVGLKHNKHFAVDILLVNVPSRIGRWIERLALGLVIAVLLTLVWKGSLFVWEVRGYRSDILEISRSWLYAALPVSAVSMLWRSIPMLLKPPSFPAEDPGV